MWDRVFCTSSFTNQSTGGFLVTPHTATRRLLVQICEWFVDKNANRESRNSKLFFFFFSSGLSDEHKEIWQPLTVRTHKPCACCWSCTTRWNAAVTYGKKRLSSSRQGKEKELKNIREVLWTWGSTLTGFKGKAGWNKRGIMGKKNTFWFNI